MNAWAVWIPSTAVAILALAAGSTTGWMVGLGVAAVGFGALSIQAALRLQRIGRALKHDDPESDDDIVRALHTRHRTWADQNRALEQQVRGLQSTVDVLPEAVIVLDSQQRILWSNETARLILDVDRARDHQAPLSLALRNPALIEALQTKFENPLRQPAPTDNDRMLEFRGLRSGGDYWLLVATDVTSAQRIETMRRDFIANLSHELKTPLTVLSGFVETLQDDPLIPAAQMQEALGHMRRQSDAMQRLVMDLLTLSRLESNDEPAPRLPVAVDAFVERALQDARSLSQGRHEISLSIEAQRHVLGNVEDLTSALGNLLANAVHYTPTGGRIAVSATRAASQELMLAVRDSGIGIATQHVPRLTERFYRVDRGRARSAGGTGLGLAIVKHIMQRHGGKLLIESAPGLGSTFTLQFPADRVR